MATSPTFDSIYREVRGGKLRPVYYLTGSEDVLKDELAQHIIDHAVDEGSRDFNLDVRAAGDLDGETLTALVETPPMLAERRVVYLKYLEQWRKNAKVWKVLERYVERPSPTTVLIILHNDGGKPNNALAKSALTIAIEPLGTQRVKRWIVRRAADNGFRIEDDGATLLQQAVGNDLMTLTAELGKLAGAVEPGATVTVEMVADLVGIRIGETPDDWVTAVIGRKTGPAVAMLDGVLGGSGITGVRLTMQLGTALVGVMVARSLLDSGTPTRGLPSAVWGVVKATRPRHIDDWKVRSELWANAARHWTTAELRQAIRVAHDADKTLKSTTVTSERGILMGMLLNFGGRKAAA